jgi:NADH:ubiquinone oxidoreductase subunit 3 (subunit A)
MYTEYSFILKYFFFCFLVSLILLLLSFIFVFQKPELEKFSAYECGFNPFEDARIKFEIKFYLVGILYIIFDLELMFLIPWVFAINMLSMVGLFSMIFFLVILTIGFYYEWGNGSLD